MDKSSVVITCLAVLHHIAGALQSQIAQHNAFTEILPFSNAKDSFVIVIHDRTTKINSNT